MIPSSRRLPPTNSLTTSIARDFRGGLNTYDTDLNLSSRYCTVLRNLYPDTNGRLRLRYGTSEFTDVGSLIDEIIGLEYYAGALIAVGKNGVIVSINASGVVTVRWNTAIAAGLPGAPAAWSGGLTFVSFTQFAGDLIICNGVDKPLRMNELYAVTYLQDLGSGSNANVPRAKYCATHNNYLILAVTPTDDYTLYIGNKGTAGTFVNDPAPNDAVNFRTDTFVDQGVPTITGLGSFRDRLMVSFNEKILPIRLGEYNGTTHVPRVDDAIANCGAVSHRSIVAMGDDMLFLDTVGLSSVERALVTQSLSPTRESTLIGEDLQVALSAFTPNQLSDSIFAIHDRITQHVLFFVPQSGTVTAATPNTVFVYCIDKVQRLRAWAKFDNMPYRCGTRTVEGRVFLAAGKKVYRYHNQFEPIFTDMSVFGSQAWDDGAFFDDGTGWQDPNTYVGTPISFQFELPWTDLRTPGNLKKSKYLVQVTEGAGQFTTAMYVDRFPNPELQMTFNATTTPANETLVARPSNNEELYAWPAQFRRMKMRVSGTASSFMGFVAIGIMHLVGSIRR